MPTLSQAGGSPAAGPASQLDANGTTLDVNAIVDGEFLKRVGTTVVSAAAGGSSLVQQASHLLTAAELNALNVTDVQIVPAPAAGNAIRIISISYHMVAGATTYDNGILTLYYGSKTGAQVLTTPPAGYPSDPGQDTWVIRNQGVTDYDPTSLVDGLAIIAHNSGVDPTQGDGTIFVVVHYITVPLA